MNITIQGHGILMEWMGQDPLRMTLPDTANFEDMKSELFDFIGECLPDKLQDITMENFLSQLLVMLNGKPISLKNEDVVINDGDVLDLYAIMVGG